MMNDKSIRCINVFKSELKKFNNLSIQYYFISNFGSLAITCDGGYQIKANSYAFIDNEGSIYDTSLAVKLYQEKIILLDECEWNITPKIQKKYDLLQEKEHEEEKKNKLIKKALEKLLENDISTLTINQIEYYDAKTLILTFVEIEDFSIKLYTIGRYGYGIDLETDLYTILVSDIECKISCEKVEKDYKSFSSAAKSRFRTMAKELGYEQITGIFYVKKREGWYETFNLQASSGNPFFYFNYGVILSENFPMPREQPRNTGWNLGGRLGSGFASGNKKQIEESAVLALELYREKVLPWFESLTLEIIEKELKI